MHFTTEKVTSKCDFLSLKQVYAHFCTALYLRGQGDSTFARTSSSRTYTQLRALATEGQRRFRSYELSIHLICKKKGIGIDFESHFLLGCQCRRRCRHRRCGRPGRGCHRRGNCRCSRHRCDRHNEQFLLLQSTNILLKDQPPQLAFRMKSSFLNLPYL